jgi:hypothetical protein
MLHHILVAVGLWLLVGLVVVLIDRKELEELLAEQPHSGLQIYDMLFWLLMVIAGPYEYARMLWHWAKDKLTADEEEEKQ